MAKTPFVIKHVGCDDSNCYAVVEHAPQTHGHVKMLKIIDWYETEDKARAEAHHLQYPEY